MKITCLFFCLSLSFLTGFAAKMDNAMVKDSLPDSLPTHIPPDKYNSFVLSGTPFSYDRLFSAFQYDSLPLPLAGQYRFGLNPYKQYFEMHSFLPPLDTNLGVSDIKVILGSTREQLLFLDHQQKISKRMTGQISYNSIVSPGFLLNCLAKFRRLKLGFNYNSNAVESFVGFQSAKVEADENGGIKPDQSIDGLSKSEFEQLQTFLSDDKRVVRRLQVEWNNSILLFSPMQKDSLASLKFKFHADAAFLKWGTSYTGSADTAFYQDVFKDTLITNDTSGYNVTSLQPALGLYMIKKGFNLSLKGGLSLAYINQRIDSVKSSPDYLSPFVTLRISSGGLSLVSTISTVTSDDVNDGDFSVNAIANFDLGNALISSLQLTTGISEVAPEATSLFYSSNHFKWRNVFKKEEYTWVKSSAAFFNNRVRLYSNFYQLKSPVYFNGLALPAQFNASVAVMESGFQCDWILRKWRVLSNVRYSGSSKSVIRVPEFGYYLRLSFRDRFFKKALLAEFGSSVYSFSDWSGYGFMPATGAMYLQQNQNVGGAPSLDVFINADIGRATLTFLMQRVNDRFFGGENYILAGYPAPPRTFKFALTWRLYN